MRVSSLLQMIRKAGSIDVQTSRSAVSCDGAAALINEKPFFDMQLVPMASIDSSERVLCSMRSIWIVRPAPFVAAGRTVFAGHNNC